MQPMNTGDLYQLSGLILSSIGGIILVHSPARIVHILLSAEKHLESSGKAKSVIPTTYLLQGFAIVSFELLRKYLIEPLSQMPTAQAATAKLLLIGVLLPVAVFALAYAVHRRHETRVEAVHMAALWGIWIGFMLQAGGFALSKLFY